MEFVSRFFRRAPDKSALFVPPKNRTGTGSHPTRALLCPSHEKSSSGRRVVSGACLECRCLEKIWETFFANTLSFTGTKIFPQSRPQPLSCLCLSLPSLVLSASRSLSRPFPRSLLQCPCLSGLAEHRTNTCSAPPLPRGLRLRKGRNLSAGSLLIFERKKLKINSGYPGNHRLRLRTN